MLSSEMVAKWPDEARRCVAALSRELELMKARAAHYANIVAEREYEWDEVDLLRGEVEALGIERYKLKLENKRLAEELRDCRLIQPELQYRVAAS